MFYMPDKRQNEPLPAEKGGVSRIMPQLSRLMRQKEPAGERP